MTPLDPTTILIPAAPQPHGFREVLAVTYCKNLPKTVGGVAR